MTNQETSPVEIDQLLSLLGDWYKEPLEIAKETFRSLSQEQAGSFTSLANDWIDILSAIRVAYSDDELRDSLLHLYFNGLFKEVSWFQLLFLGGNYPLLHRSLRYVWEMIFRAYYVDTYVQKSRDDPEPAGPTIDDKVKWLGEHERKLEMYKWPFVQGVLRQLLPQAKDTEIEEYYKSLWDKLNEYVHPSKALLDRMVVRVPGSLMTDIFDKEWALETVEMATMIFDLVWLAVFSRFSECVDILAQKGLHLEYPIVTAALKNFSKGFESMVKSIEIVTRNYAHGALRAFLEDKKNLNWTVGMIRSSGVRGLRLTEVFENLKNYGNPSRYQEALAACREQDWLD